MASVASLVRLSGWGEAVKQTLISVGTTAQKVDTLGASRILITVLETGKILWVTPDDVATTDSGIGLLLNASATVPRNEPCSLEIGLEGDASVWVTNGNAGTLKISVLHFFGTGRADTSEHNSSTMRINGWSEEIKHTQHVVASATHLKIDTLRARRVLIAPIDAGVRIFISPTDEGSNESGLICLRDNTTSHRNDPYVVELAVSGDAPLFLKGSGAGDVSVLHFYS